MKETNNCFLRISIKAPARIQIYTQHLNRFDKATNKISFFPGKCFMRNCRLECLKIIYDGRFRYKFLQQLSCKNTCFAPTAQLAEVSKMSLLEKVQVFDSRKAIKKLGG